MNSVKFIHMADVHLDSRITGLNENKSNIRRTETLLTLKNVFNKFSDAKLVFISGDLFDGTFCESTIKYLCKLFESNFDKEILISGGNHDYIGSRSMDYFIKSMPKNVTVFGGAVSCKTYEKLGVRVYGASFCSPQLYSSLLSGFEAEKDGMINIMVMHADTDGDGKYNPIEPCDIAKSNLDYLALGHKHGFSGIKKAGNTFYAYPGILEPHGFDECGNCGVIYGSVSKGVCDAAFIPVSLRKYINAEVDITGLCSDAEVYEKISGFILPENLYRINLTGSKKAGYIPNTVSLCSMINSFYCEIADKSNFERDIFSFSGENSLRGITADILKEKFCVQNAMEPMLKKEVTNILTQLLCKGGFDE